VKHDTRKGCKEMRQYMFRKYDTFFQDVRNERVAEYVNDDAAIAAAKRMLWWDIHPEDTSEIQVCREGFGMGEWYPFAVVYYCDGEIVVDDVWC
jgi:hypothetical protein